MDSVPSFRALHILRIFLPPPLFSLTAGFEDGMMAKLILCKSPFLGSGTTATRLLGLLVCPRSEWDLGGGRGVSGNGGGGKVLVLPLHGGGHHIKKMNGIVHK